MHNAADQVAKAKQLVETASVINDALDGLNKLSKQLLEHAEELTAKAQTLLAKTSVQE